MLKTITSNSAVRVVISKADGLPEGDPLKLSYCPKSTPNQAAFLLAPQVPTRFDVTIVRFIQAKRIR